MLAVASLFTACNPTPEVCLENGTNHDLVFWANDGGHYRQVGSNYCAEKEAGSYSWQADYPTKDSPSDLFASWSGSFESGSSDFKFVFTEDLGTPDYDFRDTKVGSYQFMCQTLTMMGNDTINIQLDTIIGTISKSAVLTQLAIGIAPFYTGEVLFGRNIYDFAGVTGGTGQMNPFNQFGLFVEQSGSGGSIIRKSCVGKKI